MKRLVKRCGLLALVIGLMLGTVGTGMSGAQEHDDHHGGHGGHDHDHHGTTPTSGPTTSGPGTSATTPPTQPTTTNEPTPGAQTRTLRYGPYTLPAAPEHNPDGSHNHVHTGNLFAMNVEKPCTNCYITSMRADLKYADGRQAGYSNNAVLHHMVLFNQAWGRVDPTCFVGFPFPLGLMFGQRFFASGDERTVIDMPNGFGYPVGSADRFNMIYELMSMSPQAQQVYIEMTYSYVPNSTPNMRAVEPIWFDVAQCGFSTISRPAGVSQASWTWNVNRPGGIMTIGGHIHDGGVNIEIRNDSTGQVICDSRAGYGETPLYVDHHGNRHVSSMSECNGRRGAPVATVQNGQRVTIRANYNQPEAVTDQMGIVMAFVAQNYN